MKLSRKLAGYVPGLDEAELQWQTLVFESDTERLEVAVPRLSAGQIDALASRVEAASRAHLQTLRVSQIIAIVDRAIARLLDPADAYRLEAERLLPLVTGYDAEMIRLGLTSFFKTFRAPQLQRFVAEDFANPKLLDEFQPAPKGGAVRAFGPRLLAHVWAGNTPALPLWSLVCGLLVKAGSIGKLPSAEPIFAGLFARLLAEVHPPLGDCLAVVWWPGHDATAGAPLYARAEVVLAYGSNEALAQIRNQVPITTRFLPYGHRLGFGIVSRAALDAHSGPAIARLAAMDVVRYDQQGCYSPHVYYVERGAKVEPCAFAQYLGAELANLQRRFPRRPLALEEATDVAGWRRRHELRALATSGGETIGDDTTPWSVACSNTPQPLAPSALNRTVQVVAVDVLEQAIELIAAQRPYLQTAGLAAAPSELHRLAELLGQAGVTRVAAIGSMTQPEAGWHHDGRYNLSDLVRITEVEQSVERAAELLASYRD